MDALVEREHNRVPRSRTWFRLQQEAAQLEQVEGRDEAAIARVTAAIAETRSLEGTPEARAILMQRLFLDAAVDDAQARAERVSATLERLDAWHGRLGERRTDGERLHAEAIFLVRQDQAAHAFQRLLLSARASARWRGPTDEAWAKELLEFDEGHGDEVGVPVRIAFLTALLNDPAVLDTANPAHALFRQRLTDVLIRIGQTAAAETVEKRSATRVDESEKITLAQVEERMEDLDRANSNLREQLRLGELAINPLKDANIGAISGVTKRYMDVLMKYDQIEKILEIASTIDSIVNNKSGRNKDDSALELTVVADWLEKHGLTGSAARLRNSAARERADHALEGLGLAKGETQLASDFASRVNMAARLALAARREPGIVFEDAIKRILARAESAREPAALRPILEELLFFYALSQERTGQTGFSRSLDWAHTIIANARPEYWPAILAATGVPAFATMPCSDPRGCRASGTLEGEWKRLGLPTRWEEKSKTLARAALQRGQAAIAEGRIEDARQAMLEAGRLSDVSGDEIAATRNAAALALIELYGGVAPETIRPWLSSVLEQMITAPVWDGVSIAAAVNFELKQLLADRAADAAEALIQRAMQAADRHGPELGPLLATALLGSAPLLAQPQMARRFGISLGNALVRAEGLSATRRFGVGGRGAQRDPDRPGVFDRPDS